MSEILLGKPVVEELKKNLRNQVNNYKQKGIVPTMGIIRVGAREDDLAYERGILKNCESVGIETKIYETNVNITMDEFTKLVKEINDDNKIHGILVFRPLPEQLNIDIIKNLINPKKDIDCMNPINLQKVFEGADDGFLPCTPEAVLEILKYYKIPIKGANIAIVNRSMVLGKPLAMMLLEKHATVTICHSKTVDLSYVTSKADIVIVGAGKAKMFGQEYFNKNAVVIDVGINYLEGKMCGDVNYEEVEGNVHAITPVPKGVGTVTSTILLRHVLQSIEI